MIYELTEHDFQIFKEEAKKWIAFFGLQEWEIFFCFEIDESGGRASCSTKTLHMISHLVLNKRPDLCEPPTEESIRKSAFHEVCELLLSKIRFVAFDEEIPRNERIGLADSEAHSIIRRLENSLFEQSVMK